MAVPDKNAYLKDIAKELEKQWPDNRTVNIVCHGHSVPAGYTATPFVDTFNSYTHLLHKELKRRFPFAVINVIVTAIGGENSIKGAKRFMSEVLCHKPDLITLDYGLNDRYADSVEVSNAWKYMIESALSAGAKVLLLTPTLDISFLTGYMDSDCRLLQEQASNIRELASGYSVGLCDSFRVFENMLNAGMGLLELLSYRNHPSRKGHELVTGELIEWFPLG